MEDEKKIDEQIREMNESFAAEKGYVQEEEFDAREAMYDEETDK